MPPHLPVLSSLLCTPGVKFSFLAALDRRRHVHWTHSNLLTSMQPWPEYDIYSPKYIGPEDDDEGVEVSFA